MKGALCLSKGVISSLLPKKYVAVLISVNVLG